MLDAPATVAGELSGFVAGFKGDNRLRNGDCVGYRIALDTDTIWDEDFATIIAAMVSVDNQQAVSEVWLGLGDDEGIAHEEPCGPTADDWLESGGSDWFGSGGWRFAQRPSNPFLQIRIVLRATPAAVRVKVTRLFAGQVFDPYLFNPHYEQAAEYNGWPKIANEEQVLHDFEDKAREACRTASYWAAQSFVRPFIVMREGEPRFPMLIGSVNSVLWYGIEPRHRLELYRELGCVGEGEVTLDCGAHAGQLAAYFALESGPQGRVIAFDPFAHNCLQVEAQAALNAPGRIRAVKAGVGARRQTLRVSILGQQTTAGDDRTSQDDTDIEIVPLDDYLDEKPTFIKIDVEGAEVDALIGAARLLRTCQPKIFIEVHTQFLGQFGYTLTDFFSKIPLDLYDVRFMVEGVDSAWRIYQPGLEAGVTTPLLVYAAPKAEEHSVLNGS
jgi:FkbM family methyltransferase